MKTVLIFAHECAPYHRPESTIGAQRPAQFAKWLPEFGWRTIVICCDRDRRRTLNAHALDDVEKETAARIESSLDKPSAVVPTPSLRADGLVDRAWYSLAASSISERQPALSLRKGLTALKFRSGDYSQSWQPCARVAAKTLSGLVKVDACLGEHGPDAGLFLAAWFSRKNRVPWIADFRDPVFRDRGPLMRKIYEPIVKRLVSTAFATVNVTPQWTAQDASLFSKEAVCITNGFDPSEMPTGEPRESKELTIAYVGQVVTPDQSLEPFLRGLALLADLYPEDYHAVRFMYAGQHAAYVSEACLRFGVAERATVTSQQERTEALRLMTRADILLILGTDKATPDEWIRDGLYPGKVFEYLGAGRPILCVPEDGGALKELIQRTGAGVSLTTPSEVCGYLRARVLEVRERRPIPYRPDTLEIAKYTRRSQTAALAALLDRAVARCPRSDAQLSLA